MFHLPTHHLEQFVCLDLLRSRCATMAEDSFSKYFLNLDHVFKNACASYDLGIIWSFIVNFLKVFF